MTFLTTRCVEVDVPAKKVITIPDGVLGFPGRYSLTPDPAPARPPDVAAVS